MEILKVKTNSTTSDAIEAATLTLNAIEQADANVEDTGPDSFLTVQTTDNRIADLVQQAVSQAGFQAEFINKPVQ